MIDFYSLNSFQRVTFIFLNLQVVIACVGLAGNVLTFCVYLRKRLRTFSFSLYMKVLCVTDSILLIHDFRYWAAFIGQADLTTTTDFFCTLSNYHPYFTAIISLWLLTCISADRLVTIMFPNRLKFIKSRYFQVALVAFITLFSMAIFIEMPLSYKLVLIPLGPVPNSTNDSFFNNVTNTTISNKIEFMKLCLLDPAVIRRISWINIAILVIVNVVLNNVINVLMIAHLHKSRKQVRTHHGHHTTNATERRDRKFAINSIGLNLTSTFCKLPFSIALLVTNLISMSYDEIQMFFNIMLFIINFDSSASFFVNMIANSVFAKELKTMIGLMMASISSLGTASNGSVNHLKSNENPHSNPNSHLH